MSAVTLNLRNADGNIINSSLVVVSLDVWHEVNRIPRAELRIADGSPLLGKFEVSNAADFDPGATIAIELGQLGEEVFKVFKGVVVRHKVEADRHGSLLVIVLKDVAVKLTGARRSAVFEGKTDNAIIEQIVKDAGLEMGETVETKPEHLEMVQYHSTPWNFILSRADAHGLLVAVDNGKISLHTMDGAGDAKHLVEMGVSKVFDIDIEADGASQYEAVESVGWDVKEQKVTAASKADDVAATPGKLDAGKLGQTVGQGTCLLSHAVPLANDELQAWANATMARSRMALCRGHIGLRGVGNVKLLDVIEIKGINQRFDGKTRVTSVRHRVSIAGWRTDLQFGISPEKFGRREGIADMPAAGLLPPVTGLRLGVVAEFKEDPEGELRVKVLVPAVDATNGVVWARVSSPDAGKKRGFYFRPEPGDEVVLGFLHEDPRHAVVLGSFFGSKNAPADAMGTPTEKNEQKGIVTKKGTTIGFLDGDKPSVFIETPNKNKIILDDDAESICMTDQHGNSITMNKDGIELKSAKDFTIDASGDVAIKGSKVDIQ